MLDANLANSPPRGVARDRKREAPVDAEAHRRSGTPPNPIGDIILSRILLTGKSIGQGILVTPRVRS